MARKRYPSEPPAGVAVRRPAGEVLQDTWLQDPETGQWAYVKQMTRERNGCSGFGAKPKTTVRFSLVKLGERIIDRSTLVTVLEVSA